VVEGETEQPKHLFAILLVPLHQLGGHACRVDAAGFVGDVRAVLGRERPLFDVRV
jgi:hypothetical protein